MHATKVVSPFPLGFRLEKTMSSSILVINCLVYVNSLRSRHPAKRLATRRGYFSLNIRHRLIIKRLSSRRSRRTIDKVHRVPYIHTPSIESNLFKKKSKIYSKERFDCERSVKVFWNPQHVPYLVRYVTHLPYLYIYVIHMKICGCFFLHISTFIHQNAALDPFAA